MLAKLTLQVEMTAYFVKFQFSVYIFLFFLQIIDGNGKTLGIPKMMGKL